MNTKLIACAAVLVATATLASAAEAGGGVRLGFGGPLGTFTATPAHGGGGSYQRPRLKRKAPVIHAARKPERTPRVAKAEPRAQPKATPKASVSEKKDVTEKASESEARMTGSSALIQGSIPPEEPAAAEPREETAPGATAEARSAETEEPAKAAPEQSSDASETCKKFIPAVGMTVSVGCGE